MASNEETRNKIDESLLFFIDFLYAFVFGLILTDAVSKIVWPEEHSWKLWRQRVDHIIMVVSIFYFLAWDWVHARILTLKNPYGGYTRFFLEIVIALCSYGAASAVLDSVTFNRRQNSEKFFQKSYLQEVLYQKQKGALRYENFRRLLWVVLGHWNL